MTDDLATLMRQAQDDDPLLALHATAALRREIERLEAVQVRRARVAGLAWAQIADAIGVSKQAAHKKYGRR
ncbi:hypothetical protein [Nonomuraea gerenzanensis]|uniref:RNA polymerase sigma factor 70 region 4 type 2 domain-containing protein n=1 Tax=Nonomuraea gerenzanensis TaxID=93944 RepID=A0A1M4EA20_9ACTN|nr:hypothetical protein [Nonomuraea gerenzanensis]UBU17960.1 hypothetical protein LCN96_23940 [Nonomuraea gerenzanensis]SBO95761.1 hypothetical protein BN4615_P5277 [Nonomuraea gerenzanensis]